MGLEDLCVLTERLIDRCDDEDRIYIWGYSPDLYLYTRLTSASAQVVPQNVVGDYGKANRPNINQGHLNKLLADFEKHPPRYFVDVSHASFSLAELKTGEKSDVYNINYIPAISDYLNRNF